MNGDTTNLILGRAENNCLISRSLHGLLMKAGNEDLARLAWRIYLNSSSVANLAGDNLGVESGLD